MSRYLLTGACLTALIAAVYFQTCRFAFVEFDDPQLVTENVHVRQGVTLNGVKWAFFSAWRENVFFYPLSLLSHMADVTWAGLDPGLHHLTSVALHAAATLALFALLAQLTGAVWRPALAAGLFAVHPLGADSVAWVAERSNVLCALLIITTLSAYARYLTARKKQWYGLSLGLFFLALLAKPTAVMTPAVLFLISRLRREPGADGEDRRPALRPVFMALLPFVILAAVRLLAVLAAERGASPVVPAAAMTAGTMAANGLVAMVAYLVNVVYPFRLSVYYPFPESLPPWQPVVSAAVLLLITVIMFKAGRRRPMVRLGWLWYLLFLAPSLGLVRSGPWPAMADHYAYVPVMGLFISLVWLVPPAAAGSFRGKMAMAVAGVFLLIFFAAVSFWHVGHYRDSVTLFTRAISMNPRNFVAHVGLGNAYRKLGEMASAEENFRRAIAIQPESAGAHNNLGLILAAKGEWAEAERHFKIALALAPRFSMARDNLAGLYQKQQALTETRLHPGLPGDGATEED